MNNDIYEFIQNAINMDVENFKKIQIKDIYYAKNEYGVKPIDLATIHSSHKDKYIALYLHSIGGRALGNHKMEKYLLEQLAKEAKEAKLIKMIWYGRMTIKNNLSIGGVGIDTLLDKYF